MSWRRRFVLVLIGLFIGWVLVGGTYTPPPAPVSQHTSGERS